MTDEERDILENESRMFVLGCANKISALEGTIGRQSPYTHIISPTLGRSAVTRTTHSLHCTNLAPFSGL